MGKFPIRLITAAARDERFSAFHAAAQSAD
jgi:hypothetical protein